MRRRKSPPRDYLADLRKVANRPRLYAVQFLESILQANLHGHNHHHAGFHRRVSLREDVASGSGDISDTRGGWLWVLEQSGKKKDTSIDEVGSPDVEEGQEGPISSGDTQLENHLISSEEKRTLNPSAQSTVSRFDELSHVHVWHRQGLKAPPLVFKTAKMDKEAKRPLYMLLLPQVNAQQTEHCLYCRRKRTSGVKKFRFSLNESNMSKKRNPSYIGKMKQDPRTGLYEVFLPSNLRVMTVLVDDSEVSLELQNQFLNKVEKGRQGRTIMGNIQTFVQPMLALKVDSSKVTKLRNIPPNQP
ncbi:hypothetical protein AAMO2058_000529500 [Amorphochlora amoebiformis]